MDKQPKLLYNTATLCHYVEKAILQAFEAGRYSVLQLSLLPNISLTSI